ncbi:methyl-accepting chemotaxis protein [Vibrio sp. 99-70-13A1]|uniref:methyl-accepting chemotaxis protein n=1 Tax=Vibrio sp. 99-70-13A1 TaxID=2607601 RepID=UPI001493A79D|nr:methyl-accepting chemotaxis protein [Vibrio sp. 99-70-13A1]NOH97624.1 methyl-accepting chemotaxis protein [Vibrio sp. 99-70-13A1]
MHIISGFKGKLFVAVTFLLAASLVVSNVLSYKQVSTSIHDRVNEYSMLKIETTSDTIETWLNTIKSGLTANAPDFSNAHGDEKILSMLRPIANTSLATDIFVGFEDGRAYSNASGKRDLATYDPRQRGWYQLAKQKRGMITTGIYQDALTKKLLVSIAEPFYSGGQLKGVLLADIELDLLADLVQKAPFPGAFMGIYDDTSLTIASNGEVDVPGETKLYDFDSLRPLTDILLSQSSGKADYSLNGVEKVAFFKTINVDENNGWHLMVGVDKSVAYAGVDAALEESLYTSALLLVSSFVLFFIIFNITYRPILALKSTVVDLSKGNGDLTRRLEVNTNDDLGEIAQAVNTFIGNLQTMMLDVSKSSKQISNNIEQLTNQTMSNDQVLSSHVMETTQVVAAINEMNSTAESVAQSASQTAGFTQSTNDEAAQSKLVVANSVTSVADLISEVETMAASIQSMNQDSQKISSVLAVIGEIADQTNLLALNAAIEAARAGEQGRGFAVVADEVRALAARTQHSTSEINSMLADLNEGTKTVVKAMDETKSRCEQTAEATKNVNVSLDVMVSSITHINDLGLEIATAAEEQSAVTDEVSRNMTTIQSMVNELTNNSTQTMESTQNLSQSNKQLSKLVEQFKLQ